MGGTCFRFKCHLCTSLALFAANLRMFWDLSRSYQLVPTRGISFEIAMAHNELPASNLADWFEIGKQIPKFVYSTYSSRCRLLRESDTASESSYASASTSLTSGTSYALHYQQEDRKEILNSSLCVTQPVPRNLDLEEVTTVTGSDTQFFQHSDRAQELYSKYNFKNLPTHSLISDHRDTLLKRLAVFPVIIVQGSTGCGKSTQIPQYILDYHAARKEDCNIVVTQPRRIAAMSVAKRVADERRWRLGDLVGYQIGLKSVTSENTRLTYVTTGVLLQKLVAKKSLSDYSHIIIDEVHERNQDVDFLMIVVRKLMRANSKNTKVIIMSATLNAEVYADYFSTACEDRFLPAHIYDIKEKSFDVYEFYLDDLIGLGPLPKLEVSEPSLPAESVGIACKLVERLDQIEGAEQPFEGEFAEHRGSVLIFLPGIEEINTIHSYLVKKATRMKWWLLPLHSSITLEEQSHVFKQPLKFQRKIILSTNIAESSITVSDIIYVIDFCLTRNLVCDPVTGYSGLQLEWASKANCIQRKGRAGRVTTGRVYRLVQKSFYYGYFDDYGVPEMKRCPLSTCVLQSKMLNLGEPKAILGLAIDPPDLSHLEPTILTLLEVGALTIIRNASGMVNLHDGNLTWIGEVLSKLPIAVHLGKLILLGHAFGCLKDCIIIAAGLSQRSIFSRPFSQALKAYESKFAWADHSFSDCLAIYNVFQVWQEKKNTNAFAIPGSLSEKKWAANNFVQWQRLREMQVLVGELKDRLEAVGVRTPVHPISELSNTEHKLLLKLILAGAFYPRYFVHQKLDEQKIARELDGHDPLRTVVLSGLPWHHAHLYGHAIESLLEEPCRNSLKIHFDNNSTKAYVEFLHSESRGISSEDIKHNIPPSLYLAIKMRWLRIPLQITLFSSDEANRLADRLTKTCESQGGRSSNLIRTWTHFHSSLRQVLLPSISTSVIQFIVTEIIECGHFWACYSDRDSFNEDKRIRRLIHENLKHHNGPMTTPLTPGILCLAPLVGTLNEYVRARIEFVSCDGVGVFYIDIGRTATLNTKALRPIVEEFSTLLTTPMKAFQCKLCCIRPSPIRNPTASWSAQANDYFTKLIRNKDLLGRVYSVVHNIVRLEVMYKNERNQEVSVNEELKEKHFAELAEEDYYSKQNNMLRNAEQQSYAYDDENVDDVDLYNLLPINELNKLTISGQKLNIKGPDSPLELSFGGLTRDDQTYLIRVEPDSVNSVALCTEPQDKHCRVLVASDLSFNQGRTAVIARGTTFMPNIHGLLSILCLTFAKTVELRTDPKRMKYTGLICGLGYDEATGESLHPNHDMEIAFDVAISDEDIQTANGIRIGVNLLLEDNANTWDSDSIYNAQTTLQHDLLKFVLKSRKSIEPLPFDDPNEWNQTDPNYVLIYNFDPLVEGGFNVLQLISKIVLVTERERLKENIRLQHHLISSCALRVSITCEMCDVHSSDRAELVRHLQTKEHKDKEYSLWA
ncbi:hypothetical protein CHUAL_012279 [Chamberlinius hualienensis]